LDKIIISTFGDEEFTSELGYWRRLGRSTSYPCFLELPYAWLRNLTQRDVATALPPGDPHSWTFERAVKKPGRISERIAFIL
jgi:hypothetical protein